MSSSELCSSRPLRYCTYLVLWVLLQVVGSRKDALEPCQIPPTLWRETEALMSSQDLCRHLRLAVVLARLMGKHILGQKE